MRNANCRVCLDPLDEAEEHYHPSCCKKLFGSSTPPSLPYRWEDLNKLAETIVREHITVPGVQPKLSVHLERGGGTRNARFTLVGLEGSYVLKPPVERFPEMPELEHLTMRMARCFSITTAECGLIPLEDGRLCFITKRMDREGGTMRHMEDMCQLTDRLTEQKYRGSMEQVGKAVLRYSSNPLFDAVRLFELTLFCFLTGNADMHLKNFSLIYVPGEDVALSPAYDLLPTALLLPDDREEMALTLNGKKRRLSRTDFERVGGSLKLTDKQIANVLDRLSRHLPTALDTVHRGFCGGETKQRFAALIRERARHAGL